MGRHKLWRAQAKKMRRKKIRQKAAKDRDRLLVLDEQNRAKSPRYQTWLKAQKELETFQEEEESRVQHERHIKWEQDERVAQQLWKDRQDRIIRAQEERARQEVLIREEWEEEQRKIRDAEEEKRKKEEEKKMRQEEYMKQVDEIMKRGEELPAHMIINSETHPEKPPCPFFSKTGACRFGDWCSRNHLRPSMSRVLLIPNFYSHFGLEQALVEEYDTDVMLEYGDSETYQHFRDFFDDVLPEFERHGIVTQFKVCRNFEPHLRGNVYVEYEKTCDAVEAYKTFHGRWYGGRQLNVEFTCVSSWSSAICGLYFKQRCPKGRSCNFLHVFLNPRGLFNSPMWHHQKNRNTNFPTLLRRHRALSWSRSPSNSPSPDRQRKRVKHDNWRWSESPPPLHEENEPSSRSRKRRRRSKKNSSLSRHGTRTKDSSSHRKKHRRRSPGSS